LNALAEAQRKTEERVGRLEEAVERLAEAQRKTEEEIARLSRDMRKLKKEVGGLSNTVGYTLENEAMKALPSLLEKDFGIKVEGRFVRESLELPDGRETDVNILGFGRKNGKEIVIVGEAKVQLGKKHIEKFRRKVDNVFAPYFGKEIFPLMVTHYATKSVLRTAKKNGIVVYFSYQF
ncbi:chordopoxvirus fusion protein, partial [bacterium]